MRAKNRPKFHQNSDEFEKKKLQVHHREWLYLKADIILIKLDPTFAMFYRVLKKLQCFQKVGPEVFGTSVCGNLSTKNGYQFVSKGTIDINLAAKEISC